jgi:hypothetical protein
MDGKELKIELYGHAVVLPEFGFCGSNIFVKKIN